MLLCPSRLSSPQHSLFWSWTSSGFGLGQDQFTPLVLVLGKTNSSRILPHQGRDAWASFVLVLEEACLHHQFLSEARPIPLPLAMVRQEGYPARPLRGILWYWSCRSSCAGGFPTPGVPLSGGGGPIPALATRLPYLCHIPFSPLSRDVALRSSPGLLPTPVNLI